jgi:uncharacterized protein (TIGR03437 family)
MLLLLQVKILVTGLRVTCGIFLFAGSVLGQQYVISTVAGNLPAVAGPVPATAISLMTPLTVGGLPAFVQYYCGVYGAVAGLMQVNVQIPAGVTPGGYVPVVLQVGSATTVNSALWIAVSN